MAVQSSAKKVYVYFPMLIDIITDVDVDAEVDVDDDGIHFNVG